METNTLYKYVQGSEQYKEDLQYLFRKTIIENPYIPHLPYNKQSLPIYLSMLREARIDGVKKPNDILVGAGGFGGKTWLGSMLAVQYLPQKDYTCLVTRRNYAELLDTNSVWENLLEWCCGEHLPSHLRCTAVRSPSPRIIAPNGNTIYFKAFDREEKKQKLKSASYDRIINDEASELPTGVLKFQFRSMRNTSNIPRSRINLSNPSGESTEYLVERFVDGEYPYIALDWRDNPFIDKEAYEGSLNELDYIDQQYQKYGNWHYKATAGDLINRDQLEASLVDITDYQDYKALYNVIGIDLAGKGRDNTVASSMVLFENGAIVLADLIQISNAYPEEPILRFVDKQFQLYQTNTVLFENEGGGDGLYSLRHWKNELKPVTFINGIIVKDVRPSKSKYNRARPLAKAIIDGNVHINREIPYTDLFDQFITISPSKEEMKKQKSPDDLDASAHSYNELHNITTKGVRMR